MTVLRSDNEAFSELANRANSDPEVTGLFIVGSRGKGFAYPSSDWDVFLILRDGYEDQARQDYFEAFPTIDLDVLSISEFRQHAGWDSELRQERYDFAHVTATIDKTGEVQRLLDEKCTVPIDKRDGYVRGQLDAYVNAFVRSVKAISRGNQVGARLEAATSIPYVINALFARDGRTAPFPGYLQAELDRWPLPDCPWKPAELIAVLHRILADADLTTQQNLAKEVKNIFSNSGFEDVFQTWRGQDSLAMEYHPS
jgi:hypothetical protein